MPFDVTHLQVFNLDLTKTLIFREEKKNSKKALNQRGLLNHISYLFLSKHRLNFICGFLKFHGTLYIQTGIVNKLFGDVGVGAL